MKRRSQKKSEYIPFGFMLLLLALLSASLYIMVTRDGEVEGEQAMDNDGSKPTTTRSGMGFDTNTEPLSPEARTAAERELARRQQAAYTAPEYTLELIARNLDGPGGVVVQPGSGRIMICEEYAARISVLHGDGSRTACANRSTPIYTLNDLGERVRTEALINPEGLAWHPDGSLYAVEDTPGGRVIRFTLDEAGRALEGEVIPLPGQWTAVAWEDIDIAADGRLLLAGSNAESIYDSERVDVFSGYVIYRDAQGNWWVPYDRMFASFSSVAFSKDGLNAIYTCEFSGELSWIDLTENRRAGGFCTELLDNPEGLTIMPDGAIAVAQETGSLLIYDPALDTTHALPQSLTAAEAITWDASRSRLLVSDDEDGALYALTPSRKTAKGTDRMKYARYEALVSRLNIPKDCPEYLVGVFKLAGINYRKPTEATLPFRDLTSRVPMVAADAKADPIDGENWSADPIEQVQFVVFEPNTVTLSEDGGMITSLAGFYARTRTGDTIISSTKNMRAHYIDMHEAKVLQYGTSSLVAPHASSITVTPTGTASVQFAGLGITPDFSLIINPTVVDDSYMVVFHADGSRDQYRLSLPPHAPSPDNWVIAYADQVDVSWKPLQVAVQ